MQFVEGCLQSALANFCHLQTVKTKHTLVPVSKLLSAARNNPEYLADSNLLSAARNNPERNLNTAGEHILLSLPRAAWYVPEDMEATNHPKLSQCWWL